ncbi:MAG: hypothetical protein CL733_01135 [Chloroflexi bacterium]|nr:hypothetical protein [Chloroflexota bacterium]
MTFKFPSYPLAKFNLKGVLIFSTILKYFFGVLLAHCNNYLLQSLLRHFKKCLKLFFAGEGEAEEAYNLLQVSKKSILFLKKELKSLGGFV